MSTLDQELLNMAKKKMPSAEQCKQMYSRLLCTTLKDMSFIEWRAIQLLNEHGIGISGVLSRVGEPDPAILADSMKRGKGSRQ